MEGTYVVEAGWTAGCDKCGEDETFDFVLAAREWADAHVCGSS